MRKGSVRSCDRRGTGEEERGDAESARSPNGAPSSIGVIAKLKDSPLPTLVDLPIRSKYLVYVVNQVSNGSCK